MESTRKIVLRLLAVVLVVGVLFVSGGCGSNNPAGNGANMTGAGGNTAVTLSINFPARKSQTGGMSGLISPNTATISVAVYNAAIGGNVIGSGKIIVPPQGGSASATVALNAAANFTGPIALEIQSRDIAGKWLGDLQLTNRTVVPGTNNTITATLVEVNQGMLVSGAAIPTLTAPDGAAYQINKIFSVPFGAGQYDVAMEASAASTLKVSYTSAAGATPTSAVVDGILTGYVQACEIKNSANCHTYKLDLNFNDLTNNPIVNAAVWKQSGTGSPATMVNFPYTGAWQNNVGAAAAPPAATPPAPPTGVMATTQSATQIDVNWTNVTGATGYNIYRATASPVASSAANKVNTAGPVAAGPFGNTGLSPGTIYYYVVTALNGNGESALSQEASAATPPAAPTGLSATPASSTQINLNWTAAPGAASYNVYRSTTAGFTVSAANKVGSGTGATFNDTGLTANTAYYYKVTAVNAGGESAPSTEAPATTPPAPPTGASATPGTSQNNISWSPVTGATSYNIYWLTTTGVTKANGTKMANVTSPYAHTGLTNGTTYYYVVTAVNTDGESTESAQVSAKPDYGINWTAQTPGTGQSLMGITWSGTQFVAAGGRGIIITSPDGIAWTAKTSGTTSNLFGITWSGSQFAAVGDDIPDDILTSPDGASWTARVSQYGYPIYGITWSGTQFVAVGDFGLVWTSPDGITWTPQWTPSGNRLEGVAWLGTQFVAVGWNGDISTSPNGTTWTSQVSGTVNALFGVAWSGSRYVAVGMGDTLLTSPDGITWTAQTSGVAIDLLGVTWSGTQFVAVGTRGVILTSPDGLTWTPRLSGTTNALWDVIWNGSKFVVVGEFGTVLTSP